MRVDLRSFKVLVPASSRDEQFADYQEYRQCCNALNESGRFHTEDMVQKLGYARVTQALAATIRDYPWDYEDEEIGLAVQIPMPTVARRHHVRWHRAFVQEWFLKLVRMHLI